MKTTKNKVVYEENINNLRGKANSIVIPDNEQELKTLVRVSELDIIPRGSGTSFSGACIPNQSVIVDMSKMNKIIEIDKHKKVAYIEAGVTLNELNLKLEQYGLELPIQPIIFSEIRTIGGIIATNTSGGRELKYGRIKNWVQSLEVINGNGELVEVSKSDAPDFVGMEGINGIIIRAKLKLTTRKTRTFSILRTESIDEVIDLAKKLKLDHEVSMFQLLGKKMSTLSGLQSKYHLFIEFESNKGNMKDEKYYEFLKLLKQSYYTLASNSYTILEDPRFFMDKIKDFFDYVEQKNIPYFCNLGTGVVYCGFYPDEKEKQEQTLEFVKRIRGRVSDSFGIGLLKKQFLDKTEVEIIKRIKNRHDPKNKFNRDKVLDYVKPIQEPSKEEINIPLEPQEPVFEQPAETEVVEEVKQEEQKTKTPEQIMNEFIEEQKAEDILSAKPVGDKNG